MAFKGLQKLFGDSQLELKSLQNLDENSKVYKASSENQNLMESLKKLFRNSKLIFRKTKFNWIVYKKSLSVTQNWIQMSTIHKLTKNFFEN